MSHAWWEARRKIKAQGGWGRPFQDKRVGPDKPSRFRRSVRNSGDRSPVAQTVSIRRLEHVLGAFTRHLISNLAVDWFITRPSLRPIKHATQSPLELEFLRHPIARLSPVRRSL